MANKINNKMFSPPARTRNKFRADPNQEITACSPNTAAAKEAPWRASASVQVSNFLLDGAGRTIGFNSSATEDGQPAACIRSDTSEAEVPLFYGEIP